MTFYFMHFVILNLKSMFYVLKEPFQQERHHGRVSDGRPEHAATSGGHQHPRLLHVRHLDPGDACRNVHRWDAVLRLSDRNMSRHFNVCFHFRTAFVSSTTDQQF